MPSFFDVLGQGNALVPTDLSALCHYHKIVNESFPFLPLHERRGITSSDSGHYVQEEGITETKRHRVVQASFYIQSAGLQING